LVHIKSKNYDINCNWKVFVDNYLDGGYHVPYAHRALSGNLDLSTYKSYPLSEHFMQTCASQPASGRLGGTDAVHVFQYPNFMVNRYGQWMDTNTVYPLGADKCRVQFDWYVAPEIAGTSAVEKALADSEVVQAEDIFLCDRVQRGLLSDGYEVGRYAPTVEGGEYMFHQRLNQDLSSASQIAAQQ